MQAVIRGALISGLLCLLWACHTSPAVPPDGHEHEGDAPEQGDTNIRVSWMINPQVPGTAGNNVIVEETVFKLLAMHITGDAASESTPAEVDLTWRAGTAPQNIEFQSVPTGLYSSVELRVDGQLQDNSWWILGHVTVNGTSYPYKIYDRNYLDVSLPISSTLAPGGSIALEVDIDLTKALDPTNFALVDNEGGTLVLDTYDSYMTTFRANLATAFTIKSLN